MKFPGQLPYIDCQTASVVSILTSRAENTIPKLMKVTKLVKIISNRVMLYLNSKNLMKISTFELERKKEREIHCLAPRVYKGANCH